MSIHQKIRANEIRRAWRNAPDGKAKDTMMKYAQMLKDGKIRKGITRNMK